MAKCQMLSTYFYIYFKRKKEYIFQANIHISFCHVFCKNNFIKFFLWSVSFVSFVLHSFYMKVINKYLMRVSGKCEVRCQKRDIMDPIIIISTIIDVIRLVTKERRSSFFNLIKLKQSIIQLNLRRRRSEEIES